MTECARTSNRQRVEDREKTELCGPCYFGEAACADPDEWAT